MSAVATTNDLITMCMIALAHRHHEYLASSAPDRRVSIAFSFVTVRTQTRFAFSKIGIASAIARVAGRLKSQATITVSSANDPIRFRVCGKTTVGRPEPKMMDSAYH